MTLEELLPTLSPESRAALVGILVTLKSPEHLADRPEVWDLLLAYRSIDRDTMNTLLDEAEKQYCLECGDVAHDEEDHADELDTPSPDQLNEPLELDDDLVANVLAHFEKLSPFERLYVVDHLAPMGGTKQDEVSRAALAFLLVSNLKRLDDCDTATLTEKLRRHYHPCCGYSRAEPGGCICGESRYA